jgi:hypothetical protein
MRLIVLSIKAILRIGLLPLRKQQKVVSTKHLRQTQVLLAAKLKDPKLKYNAPAAKAQVSAVQTVATLQ